MNLPQLCKYLVAPLTAATILTGACTSQSHPAQIKPLTSQSPTRIVESTKVPPTFTPTITPTSMIELTKIIPTNTPAVTRTPAATPTPKIQIYPTATPSPTVPPTDTPETTRTKRKSHIVFVAGICSTNSRDDFNELEDWLVENMGYEHSDFEYYNYATDGQSGGTYDLGATLKSIDGEGGSAENLHKFLMKLYSRFKDDDFYMIAHSLGGDVALYAFNQYPQLPKIVRGILTVDSPLRGEGLLKSNAARVFTCVHDYEDVKHLIPIPVLVDIQRGSTVISAMDIDYSTSGTRVVTLANSTDYTLISNDYPAGKLGTLDGAMVYIRSFGIDPSKNIIGRLVELGGSLPEQHRIPLRIKTLENNGKTAEAKFVGRALRCALIGDNCTYKN